MKTKNKIILCAISFLMLFALPGKAFAATTDAARVVDNAGILTEEEAAGFENELRALSDQYDMEFVLFFEDSTPSSYYGSYGSEHVMYYCADLLDYGGYANDGLALLVTVQDREWTLVTEGKGDSIFYQSVQDDLSNALLDYLKDSDYAGASSRYVSFVEERMDRYTNPPQVSTETTEEYESDTGSWGILSEIRACFFFMGTYIGYILASAAATGLIAALIKVAKLKGELHSVENNNTAGNYMVADSMNISSSGDTFLYRTETRTRIVHNDSDSSGSFTGSSGDTHTGSHGSF